MHRELIVALAARHRLPAVYAYRYPRRSGGLISYGPDQIDQYRRAAGYVDRILKGEKPADLPVQAPTKYELVINLKTAKALGLDSAADAARPRRRGDRMKRREFITLLGGAAAAWPLAARAQQPGKMARIGFLGSATAAGSAKSVEALRAGLRDFGHVEGRNIVIEFRWAEGKYDRLSDLVAELIRLNVDVIVTHGTPGTRTAKQATTTIPIVMAISGDAIATGIVTSLAQPEANLTGSTFFLPELNAKRLELLKEACPQVARVAALSNPNNPVSKPIIPAMQAAATPLKLEIDAATAQGPSEFDSAFAAMAKSRVDAVVVTEDGEFAASFGTIAALSAANKLASIGSPEYAQAGGLIGYGVNLPGLYRRAAYFVDRILKGAKPADLPIEQPTKFELVVNLKTAKALGLDVPATVLARADEVIE